MIYINFPFHIPSGGGNSFLRRLKQYLIKNKYYSNLIGSKIIIFNSHHNSFSTLVLKFLFRKKLFIHRVDGPMSLYRGVNDKRDKIVSEINKIADYTIEVPDSIESITPFITVIPLQLLSYHIAVMLGKNVDQPRNLAKSVTVE